MCGTPVAANDPAPPSACDRCRPWESAAAHQQPGAGAVVDRDENALPRFDRNEPGLTVLHISDPQFGKHHRFADPASGVDTLLRRLCDDLDWLARVYGLAPDVVVLTGDLAEWGMPAEFEQVAVFCEQLRDHLKLDPERLLIVPGNHDINRMHCLSYFNGCAGDGVEARRTGPSGSTISACSSGCTGISNATASPSPNRGPCSRSARSSS